MALSECQSDRESGISHARKAICKEGAGDADGTGSNPAAWNTASERRMCAADVTSTKCWTLCDRSSGPTSVACSRVVFDAESSTTDITNYINNAALTTFDHAAQRTVYSVAKSHDVSPDELTWTFHLRHGMRWKNPPASTLSTASRAPKRSEGLRNSSMKAGS